MTRIKIPKGSLIQAFEGWAGATRSQPQVSPLIRTFLGRTVLNRGERETLGTKLPFVKGNEDLRQEIDHIAIASVYKEVILTSL